MRQKVFLGIDAGGTHTRALIATESGDILSVGRSQGANKNTAGDQNARHSIGEAINQAISNTSPSDFISKKSILSCYIGSAALETKLSEDTTLREYSEILPHTQFIGVDSDAYTALVGAHGDKKGIITISGTGSVSVAVDTQHCQYMTGGWGAYFGDEGSAYYIGSMLIRQIIHILDQSQHTHEAQDLVKCFFEYIGLEHILLKDYFSIKSSLVKKLYGSESVRLVSNFASYVSKKLTENTIVKNVCLNAGSCLGQQLHSLIQKMNDTTHPPKSNTDTSSTDLAISYSGSVLLNNMNVQNAFLDYVNTHIVFRDLYSPKFPQIIGALLLAYEQTGITIEKNLIQHISLSIQDKDIFTSLS